MFTGRIDIEAETPILWPPDMKSWLIWKDPDAGKFWGQEKKGTTEDEMVGWHHWLDGHRFGWTPGVGDRQGGLACCSPWDRKESDMTEWLNWTESGKELYEQIVWGGGVKKSEREKSPGDCLILNMNPYKAQPKPSITHLQDGPKPWYRRLKRF